MNSADLTKLHDDCAAAWMRDDRKTAMSFWADKIAIRAAGSNPHAGLYRRIGNNHVFTMVHERFWKTDGRVFETNRIVIYRGSDGKIVEVLYFDPEQSAADAFWSDRLVD
jgi:hypothetical protein